METKIISEHKKIPKNRPVQKGKKRVMAIVNTNKGPVTRHMDVPLDFKGGHLADAQ